MKIHRPTLAALLLGLALLTACGDEAPPLEPPDPAREAIRLEWTSYVSDGDDRIRPVATITLELTPDRRFRYETRATEGEDAGRDHVVAGTWFRVGAAAWVLEPDAGRRGLDEAEFDADAWPRLKWSSLAVMEGLGPMAGPQYVVPWLDLGTGLFTSSVSFQMDPRGR